MKIKNVALNTLTVCLALVPLGMMYTALTHELSPGGRSLFAHGQTGPTGATGPTGPTGSQGLVNNHTLFGGSAPTLSNCGTSPTNTNSVDNKGIVTIGKNSVNNLGQVVPVAQCTMTFATAFTTVPSMTFGTNTKGFGVTFAGISTTIVTVYFSKDGSQLQFSYHAF